MITRLYGLLSMESTVNARRCISTFASPLLFRMTPTLWGEPLKKKKKIDPAILRMREDRKRRKIEKEIRKLEKVARKFKPIDEMEIPLKFSEEKKIRTRKLPLLTEDEKDYRSDLLKEWTHYKNAQHIIEMKTLEKMIASQSTALNELRIVSEDLYLAALEPDMTTIPFTAKGPVHTPPIENYTIIDGDYKDITKNWE